MSKTSEGNCTTVQMLFSRVSKFTYPYKSTTLMLQFSSFSTAEKQSLKNVCLGNTCYYIQLYLLESKAIITTSASKLSCIMLFLHVGIITIEGSNSKQFHCNNYFVCIHSMHIHRTWCERCGPQWYKCTNAKKTFYTSPHIAAIAKLHMYLCCSWFLGPNNMHSGPVHPKPSQTLLH